MSVKAHDRFWAADNDEIERGFLGGRNITDLPAVAEDRRVPPQGRWQLDRTVNVDTTVERYLASPCPDSSPRHIGLLTRVFDRLVFG